MFDRTACPDAKLLAARPFCQPDRTCSVFCASRSGVEGSNAISCLLSREPTAALRRPTTRLRAAISPDGGLAGAQVKAAMPGSPFSIARWWAGRVPTRARYLMMFGRRARSYG
jgi:hypothetical protein